MQYFIYADDFGWQPNKTQAIDQAFCNGWIQGTGLIVNSDNLHEAVQLAKNHGYSDKVCFHLNLTDGMPLTNDIRHTAMCNEKGEFRKLKPFVIQKKCMSWGSIRAIRKECEAQMQLYRECGFNSEHIDSHRWCLCNIPVWFAIKPLLKKYGFKTTRTLKGHLLNQKSKKRRLLYKLMAFQMKRSLTINESWSGCMGELHEAIERGKIDENSRIELYVHPEMIDGVSTDIIYSYNKQKKPLESVILEARKFGSPSDRKS